MDHVANKLSFIWPIFNILVTIRSLNYDVILEYMTNMLTLSLNLIIDIDLNILRLVYIRTIPHMVNML